MRQGLFPQAPGYSRSCPVTGGSAERKLRGSHQRRPRPSCGTAAKRKYSSQLGFRWKARPRKPGSGQQGRDVMARETGGDTADGNKFETSRRRFLGSSGLATIGAVIGGALPLSRNGIGIPQAYAQAAPAAAPPSPAPAKGPQYLKFPG